MSANYWSIGALYEAGLLSVVYYSDISIRMKDDEIPCNVMVIGLT